MGVFNLKAAKAISGSKGSAYEFANGKYEGEIADVELKKTKEGHNMLVLWLDLVLPKITVDSGGEVKKLRHSILLDHPKTAESASEAVSSIVLGGVLNPPEEIATASELAAYIKGVPVSVGIKQRGINDAGYMQYSVFFNNVKNKIEKTVAVTKTVVY
jgi:hypothetical protein